MFYDYQQFVNTKSHYTYGLLSLSEGIKIIFTLRYIIFLMAIYVLFLLL